jgi:mannose-6-phosphate isomerase-like protein (cupin superfamily)
MRYVAHPWQTFKKPLNGLSPRFSVASAQPAPHHSRAMDIRNLDAAQPFITKDGSEIRELLAHRNSLIRNQSLAEARVPVGGSTQEHYHIKTEEIYFITAGRGRMRIETETAEVKLGDAIAILPGKKHKIWNTGSETLKLLCCCSPAYEHGDTIITEGNDK